MKILILPDIHGRTFWKDPIKNYKLFDKIIFLGDYLDPYGFEKNEIDPISNFIDILEAIKNIKDKVVMLLGNHDMPYYSQKYCRFNDYHSRHDWHNHTTIQLLFEQNKNLFKIAHTEDGILFTHAGCTPYWLQQIFDTDEPVSEDKLNNLLKDNLQALYTIGAERGGYDISGSCIWADVTEHIFKSLPIKQIFGHTLLAKLEVGNVIYGKPIEDKNWKMLDTAKPYVLDTESFTLLDNVI